MNVTYEGPGKLNILSLIMKHRYVNAYEGAGYKHMISSMNHVQGACKDLICMYKAYMNVMYEKHIFNYETYETCECMKGQVINI